MAIKAGNTHDISFLTPDGDEIGLILYRDMNPSHSAYNVPVYSEVDDPALSSQYYSGEIGYANLPPEKEIQIAQDDWRSGVGLEIFDSSDDKRYWNSINMDLRFKGMAQCGPLATAISKDDGVIKAACEYSGEMYIGNGKKLQKLNATGDGFDDVETFDYDITDLEVYDGNLYVALGGDNKYEYTTAGSATLTLRPNANGSVGAGIQTYGAASAYQCVDEASANDDTDYIYVGEDAVGSVVFALPDHTTETGTINHVKVYARCKYTGSGSTYLVYCRLRINSSWYHGANYAQTLTNSYASYTDTWTTNPNTGSAWTWDDIDGLQAGVTLYAGVGLNARCTQIYVEVNYSTGEQTFVTSTLSEADFFQVVDETLWKAKKPNELKSATDPTNDGSWSSATTVGSTTYNITDLQEESGQLFVMKEDMPWYLDTDGNVHRLIPELKTLQSSTSGQNSDVFQKKIYIPCGTQSIVEYDDGTVTFRDPADKLSGIVEFTGRVRAVTHDERYLFLAVDSIGGSSYGGVLACREEVIDGSTTWVIHPITSFSLRNYQYAWVSNIYRKRLYIAPIDETEDIYYYALPTSYGDLDSDTNCTFGSNGYFITPYLHASFKADNKAFIKLTLTLRDTSDTEYFEAHYRLLGETDWTDIGDFKTEPTTTQYIPVDANDVNPSGVMIQFKFVAVTGDSSTTPKLLGYDCRGIWYPTKRKLITCQVRVSDDITPKKGGTEVQTAAQIRTAIDAASAATWPVGFYDPWAKSTDDMVYVKFLEVSKGMASIAKGRNPEEVYDLTLEKVTLS